MRKREALKILRAQDPMYRIWLQRRRSAKLEMDALAAALFHAARNPRLGDGGQFLQDLETARENWRRANRMCADYRACRRELLKVSGQ